ncbi:MAG TPA: universal stress protein [Pyrinomonadaceae bacterium]|nr:universal stress protein [Pyrinomonadaceae bacterium]
MAIKSILCPTDLTTGSDQALRYALALARAYQARLTAFHCEPPNREEELMQTELKASFEQSLFQQLGPAELATIEWERVVEQSSDPGNAIIEFAAERSVDLIVMRSRRRLHRAALLGSTAESVCRSAPCPVLVMHTDERDWVEEATHEVTLKRVLVAYDFSDYSELALNYGLSFAQEYQAELHLLHVMPPSSLEEPEISWYPLGKEGTYHRAARRLQRAVPAEAHLWCQVKHAVSEGQPYREILNYAERNQIDLICLGAHGAGFGMRALFGSNVDRVLRQAPCPVLVTRPLKPTYQVLGSGFTRISADQMKEQKINSEVRVTP